MNKKHWLAFCLCALLLQGCGDQVSVKGKVTFPDGTPLTRGEVRFQNATVLATGNIKPDGTYVISSLGNNDGLSKGTYTVTIQAMQEAPPGASTTTIAGISEGNIHSGNFTIESLVDLKYNSPETSGLSCNVQGSTVFDITVEPFRK